MRSLTFCTLLLALTACGDDGGTTDQTTGDATTGTAGVSSTGSTDTGEPTTSGSSTTAEPQTGSDSATTTTTTTTTTTGETTTLDTTTLDTTTGDGTETTLEDTTDATTGGTGMTSEASTGDTTGGATSDLTIAVVDAELYADCMPEVEADPAWGSWYVEYDNTANAEATSATLVKATLSLLADPQMVEEIEATPTESGPLPAGEYISQKLTKLKGAAHSACDHCNEFYLLELTYQEGDVTHVVTEEVTISCSF